jgi:uncharacterized protein (TIGR02145 family)
MSVKFSNWLFAIIIGVITAIAVLTTSCQKPNDNSTQVVSDYDGNVYHTVTVGNQEWMVENLKVTHFNDGREIPLVADQNIWNDLPNIKSPGYCLYNNNEANKSIYGCLYNWYSIDNPLLVPSGWRVANNYDWQTLIDYLGGLDVAGGKMKDIGITYWKSPNDGATNESGLTVLPAGYRGHDNFAGLGESTSMASADLYNDSTVLAISAYSYQVRSNYGGGGLEVGLSVRCVKNVPLMNDGAR